MRNAGLEEAQAGIRIAGRNINNLRYADDTTLMAESEEELSSLLMKVKEESEKAGSKLHIQKTKILASSPITSWQIEGKKSRSRKSRNSNRELSPISYNNLPSSKCILISPCAVILEPRKIVCHSFFCFPFYFPGSDGTRCHDLSF